MATIVLSAVGGAAGAAIGGSVLGISSVVIGQAIGATAGYWIDQQILGNGSEVVETGKVERFRLQGASEGDPLRNVFGRVRIAGQVIWATQFLETVTISGGSGKGTAGSSEPETHSYSYSVSLAVALCEGEITGVGRIWADGQEMLRDGVTMRVYKGTEDQLPDPKIAAVQGADDAPAYRGTAYVVFEDLQLAPFGNRVPQFSFEVMRPEQPGAEGEPEIARGTRAVALMPGTGEYALATEPVWYDEGPGAQVPANVNSMSGQTDFLTSLQALKDELPNCGAVSLIVSWFGDDLRCGDCRLRPKVEQALNEGHPMPWTASGLTRSEAIELPREGGRPIYGGTPTDQSVMQALAAMREAGLSVTFYPFLLMDQTEGNTLPNPWSGGVGQPKLPWRGRITTSLAPGLSGTPDRTADAEAEVAAFFGQAKPDDFAQTDTGVSYSGPEEWSFRRFILHYAHLCAAAGGVDAFCIGSEMRGLTQIRGAGDSFPSVEAFRQLAADVRAIVGPATKIGYAADWSEYFGYHPSGQPGDVYFHLDPLWADANIDFVGIDNYMPLSDWRDSTDHEDAHWESIYNLDYLRANIAGGEGFQWYYASDAARDAQTRTPIEDGTHNEPWVYRFKDLKGWWSNPHHARIGGERQASASPWVPMSKPIWFTEMGCAAIDKGTNQPNKFLDPKSSESQIPHYSTGARDEYIQMQYLRAMFTFWEAPENNPVSSVYGGPMVDTSRSHVWAWDARPYPHFPSDTSLWSDGGNYARGHWITGRTASRSLAGVVREVCARSGVTGVDTARLYGLVRGYTSPDTGSARSALQPLMLAYGFDAVERGGQLIFRSRTGRVDRVLDRETLALSDELDGTLELVRAPEAEVAGRLRLVFTEADGNYETRAEEAIFADEETHAVQQSDVPLVLSRAEARAIVERWLAEARVARDSLRFSLPPSALGTVAGDVVRVELDQGPTDFRIDRVERAGVQHMEAVRVDGTLFDRVLLPETPARAPVVVRAAPVYPVFLDLPLLNGDEVPHAPHLAATAIPWPGSVNLFSAAQDAGYRFNTRLFRAAVIGVTETPLAAAEAGRLDRGAPLGVRLFAGALASVTQEALLNGANAAAVGDPESGVWEVFQFRDAVLTAPMSYLLSGRLRGQAGTDAVMPSVWTAGSHFVLLDGAAQQIDLRAADRGLARHYRIGPANVGYDHAAYGHVVKAFDGVGLRPYAPAHLRVAARADGGHDASWIRRTRVDGDSWASWDVPLGETREVYLVQVFADGALRREVTVIAPEWTYSAAEKAADGISGPFEIAVAQISDSFGPGPFTRRTIHG